MYSLAYQGMELHICLANLKLQSEFFSKPKHLERECINNNITICIVFVVFTMLTTYAAQVTWITPAA